MIPQNTLSYKTCQEKKDSIPRRVNWKTPHTSIPLYKNHSTHHHIAGSKKVFTKETCSLFNSLDYTEFIPSINSIIASFVLRSTVPFASLNTKEFLAVLNPVDLILLLKHALYVASAIHFSWFPSFLPFPSFNFHPSIYFWFFLYQLKNHLPINLFWSAQESAPGPFLFLLKNLSLCYGHLHTQP